MTVRDASEPSSSDGLGGRGPEASTSTPGNLVGCRTSSTSACPDSTVDSPTDPIRPRYFETRGRRRSPSTRTTRCPASASTRARLTAVVVLPSPGTAEVTTRTRGGESTSRNCRLVRSSRNDSAVPEEDSANESAFSSLMVLSKGTTPTTGLSLRPASVSRSLTVLSRRSRITARAMPSSRPTAMPRARLRVVLGEIGAVGTCAGSTTLTWASAAPPPGGVSRSSTKSTKVVPMPLARSRATTASASDTQVSIRTVSGEEVVVTFDASCAGVTESPRASTVRAATASPPSSWV